MDIFHELPKQPSYIIVYYQVFDVRMSHDGLYI